ncbi:hypothetical protein BKH43_07390 [Helicobacter sp. 13S00401-1]|uniref:hypothetical protein n=1 Tax=Helicobacter sp. 13S00401-1 TaxID=1905758 RepID=UPI000BA59BF1|nr:hypothetical protein [Helicobacter sp. 13S00401-1]PAF49008.1 hypothetical protein BKH43_07390 [Helicobacter sp. 13S00401-1]
MPTLVKTFITTALVLSLSSYALAQKSTTLDTQSTYDINGARFLLGGGIGSGIRLANVHEGSTYGIRFSRAGLNARLKLGGGFFTTTANSTLGLQASIGIGANTLESSFTPQYSINLDFIQAFKVGESGKFKIGYILGVGAFIRTNDVINSGSGNINTNLSSSLAATPTRDNTALLALPPSFNAKLNTNSTTNSSFEDNLTAPSTSGNISTLRSILDTLDSTAASISTLSIEGGNNLIKLQGELTSKQLSLPEYQREFNTANSALNNALSTLNNYNTQIQEQTKKRDDASNFIRSNRGTSQPLTAYINPDSGAYYGNTDNIFIGSAWYANQIRDEANKLNDATIALAKLAMQEKAITNNLGNLIAAKSAKSEQLNSLNTSLNTLQNEINNQHDLINKYQDLITSMQKLKTQIANASSNNSSNNQSTLLLLQQAKLELSKADAILKQEKSTTPKTLLASIQDPQTTTKEEKVETAKKDTNKEPFILPTIKFGVIAFIGKRQSLSLEYQHYFRNTNPNLASGDITLNYTYYFGN